MAFVERRCFVDLFHECRGSLPDQFADYDHILKEVGNQSKVDIIVLRAYDTILVCNAVNVLEFKMPTQLTSNIRLARGQQQRIDQQSLSAIDQGNE